MSTPPDSPAGSASGQGADPLTTPAGPGLGRVADPSAIPAGPGLGRVADPSATPAGPASGQGGDPPATAAAVVMQLVEDQLAEERCTKSSIEARAISVITSSGALATLLFAFAALVTDSETYTLPLLARIGLALALLAFIAAGVIALFAAKPETYQEVSVKSLRAATAHMGEPAEEAQPSVANVLVDIIASAREENAAKAQHLRRAVVVEAVAASVLAVVVGIILVAG